MSETKHTPGPWAASDSIPGSPNARKIVGANSVHVASLSRTADKPLQQKEADGFLIAAAPELLVGLEVALPLLFVAALEAEKHGDGEFYERLQETMTALRVVIARATGN